MRQLNAETKEFIKQQRIERIIDYLQETAYLTDIEINESDDYFTFFNQLYEFFENKNIEKYYFEIVSKYILVCSNMVDIINVQELVEHLDVLVSLGIKTVEIPNEVWKELKELIETSKTKRLTSN